MCYLSTSHSLFFTLGSVVTASHGENSIRTHAQDESFRLCAEGANYGVSADLFASASLNAQLGNFQKPFLDLTRFHTRVDIPSGSKFVNGACKVARALYNSEAPSVEAVEAISPSATLSFQQQVTFIIKFSICSWYLSFSFSIWNLLTHPQIRYRHFCFQIYRK